MERITSRQNPLITRLRRLGAEKKTRRAQGVFLCEGTKLVGEALRWGPPPELLAVAEGTAPPAELPAGVRVVEVPEALLRAVSTVETLFVVGINFIGDGLRDATDPSQIG